MIKMGREITGRAATFEREWLVTNGIGGYACGTIGGALTRVYHGLLVAAVNPPLGRTVMLTKIDETVRLREHAMPLYTNFWAGNENPTPKGHLQIESFALRGGVVPTWTFAVDDARLEKTVWMHYGSNTSYVRYRYRYGQAPLDLDLRLLANYKDSHGVIAGSFAVSNDLTDEQTMRVVAHENAVNYTLHTNRGSIEPQHVWYRDYALPAESDRGLPDRTDHLHVARVRVTLQPGEDIVITATCDDDLLAATPYDESHAMARADEWRGYVQDEPDWVQQIAIATDQFIVQRPTENDEDGRSVIAGYPWFGDWGRDTMIALPGLTLYTGRAGDASKILRTFAEYVDGGMLPNRFPDSGEEPEYNTVDATLWYFEALRATHEVTGDLDLLRELYPTLQDIVQQHSNGTRYSIHVDENDGLLYSGEEGVQLTWMDAKVGDVVFTPRTGKAIEVNALWYNALRILADFARLLGELDADEYDTLANRVEQSFAKFWYAEGGYCYDVIDTPDGTPDASLRPNQLFAVSLLNSPLTDEQQRGVVDACQRDLLTSMGLRSLSPDHPSYRGDYGGSPYERDSRYHQGTIWPWLIGPFVEAHYRVYENRDAVRLFLQPFEHHLGDACVGTISEVAQGNAPFLPKAAFAQAWSVAEVLRVWLLYASENTK